MKLAILSYMATYGNGPLLARGLAALGHEVNLIVAWRDSYRFCEEFPCILLNGPADRHRAGEILQQADGLIMLGTPGLTHLGNLPHWDSPPKKLLVITDSHFLKNPIGIISSVIAHDAGPISLAAMADKLPIVRAILPDTPCALYRPPVKAMFVNRPEDRLTICHSPGKPQRAVWKGTELVMDTLNSLANKYPSLKVEILRGLPHQEALRQRARADIFVDQCISPIPLGTGIPEWSGGIGKSGYEAMAAGCAVLASGQIDGPAVPVTPDTLQTTLEALIEDAPRRMALRETSRLFGFCLTPESVAYNVLDIME